MLFCNPSKWHIPGGVQEQMEPKPSFLFYIGAYVWGIKQSHDVVVDMDFKFRRFDYFNDLDTIFENGHMVFVKFYKVSIQVRFDVKRFFEEQENQMKGKS